MIAPSLVAVLLAGLTSTSSTASDAAPVAGLPDSLPKFVLKSADSELRLVFMGQLRFTYSDSDVTEAPAGTEKLTLQRVRPILLGKFLGGKLGFKLHLNTGPTTIELLDLFVDYVFDGGIRLRVGQQKIPFTRYRLNSFARLTFVDWSPAARAFGLERQIGFTASGSLSDTVGYAVGLYTGRNARAGFEQGLAQVYGEKLDNPSQLDDPAAPARVHPELAFHINWKSGKDAFKSASDSQGGPLRAFLGLSGTWDLRPEAARDFAMRLGPEVMLKLHGFSFVAVGYLGTIETAVDDKMKLGMLGATLQSAYRFAKMWEVSLRYARVQILEPARADALSRAAADLALATPPDVSFRQEVTLGFNVYLVGNALKWQSDVALSYAGPGGDPCFAVRSQLQVLF